MAYFEADVQCLSKMVVTRPARRQEINDFLEHNMSNKFCSLCSHFNINPMHDLALPCVLVLMCKSRESVALCREFLTLHGDDSVHLDPRLDHDSSALSTATETFATISDWAMLLDHIDVHLEVTDMEFIESNAVMQRMREALKEAGLSTPQVVSEPQFLVLCLFYMAPRTTLAPKMMERLNQRMGVHRTDIELRCMRFVTRFMDVAMDESAQNALYVRLGGSLRVRDVFFVKVRRAVTEAAAADVAAKSMVRSQRMQLRYVAATLHNANDLSYAQTFDNWRSMHKFGNTTSTQLQRLLYFVCAQETPPPEDAYAHLFSRETIQRVHSCVLERIDVRAIIDVVRSLHFYTNGISDLLDFRTQCLEGLSLTTRKKMTLSQCAQLYVCMFQHDSVWEECWRAIINVINHTIITARTRFRTTHVFNGAAVCRNIIECHVRTAMSQPVSDGA
jgi:hypothetical protein